MAPPVPLLLADGSTIMVDVRNLTPDQAQQVFAADHIRSAGEQRAFYEDKKAMAGAVTVNGATVKCYTTQSVTVAILGAVAAPITTAASGLTVQVFAIPTTP